MIYDEPIESLFEFVSTMFIQAVEKEGIVEEIFGESLHDLNFPLLESTFAEVAYRKIKTLANNDLSYFSSIHNAEKLQDLITADWPLIYYLETLCDEELCHKFEDGISILDEEAVYALKSAYSPILATILIEVDTSEGQ